MNSKPTDSQLSDLFEQARAQYPHTKEIVYLNCAANSPFSIDIETAISQYVKQRIINGGDAHSYLRQIAAESRELIARLFGAHPDEIGLSSSTTFGLNLAAFGLPLKEGDEILFDDHEFPAAVYTWRAAAEQRGYKIEFVKSANSAFDVEAFKNSITDRTRVLCLSWVQFYNGYRNDLEEIGHICRQHGIYFVVDGIQAAGTMPLNLNELPIDIFTAGSQKWLLSSQGGGFFYIRKDLQPKMTQPVASWLDVDWGGVYTDLCHYDKSILNNAQRFEMGYYNVLNIVALLPPLKMFEQLGLANIYEHNCRLIDRLADYIKRSDKYRVTSNLDPKHRSSMLTFTCDGYEKLADELGRNGIVIVCREGSLRVSVHLYNNEADIDRMIAVLDTFAGSN